MVLSTFEFDEHIVYLYVLKI